MAALGYGFQQYQCRLLAEPWPRMSSTLLREGVENYGHVRDGIYAMTTPKDEKVAGV